ncbi:GNAT family N-acetyltransferase [Amphibacillus indicireducens]|uniref:N-acetyltransferase domain-containing protein n=1 Tax=Amphibacillus indicireducens TaxID=1076330 RepID=A0ABP7W089_9BACI
MFLNNHNLTIRSATNNDVGLLISWWNNGKVMAHAGFPNGLGITSEQVDKQINDSKDNVSELLIIELNKIPIGEMNYRLLNNGNLEIGIKICDFSKHNQGYGRILLSMLIKELFKRGFETIVLDTNLNNLQAQRLYEKLGFRKISIRRNAWKDQLGAPQSVIDYEMKQGELIDYSVL